jgi:hypothetical protein
VAPGSAIGVVVTDPALPDVLPPRRVVVDPFVDDVPLGDHARKLLAEVSDHGVDVVAQERDRLLARRRELLQPGRHLRVPDQHVAAHRHPVALGERRDPVGVGEVVAAGLGVQRPPVRVVLEHQCVHVLADEGRVFGVGEVLVGDRGAEAHAGAVRVFAEGERGVLGGGCLGRAEEREGARARDDPVLHRPNVRLGRPARATSDIHTITP